MTRGRVTRAVFCVLTVLISGCLAVETVTPEAETETAANHPQDVNATVLVSFGDKTLTMEQAKWGVPVPSVVNLSLYANFWIETELLYEEAKRRGLTESDKEAFLADIEMKKTFGQFIVQDQQEHIDVTEEEVKDYYDKNKLTDPYIYIPAVYGFSHIRVRTLREANNVIKFLKAGEDFNELAKKVSIADDAREGGRIDRKGPNLIRKNYGQAFLEALDKALVGQVIGPVPVDDYYEIIRKDFYKPIQPRSYERMRGRIRTKLLSEKREAAFDELINSLKEKSRQPIEKSEKLLEMEKETEKRLTPPPGIR